MGEVKKVTEGEGVRVLCFMRVALGKNDEVFEKLKEIPEIKDIYYITGKYDLAIIIETATPEDLHDIFTQKIDPLDGILKSNSHFIMKHWEQ